MHPDHEDRIGRGMSNSLMPFEQLRNVGRRCSLNQIRNSHGIGTEPFAPVGIAGLIVPKGIGEITSLFIGRAKREMKMERVLVAGFATQRCALSKCRGH